MSDKIEKYRTKNEKIWEDTLTDVQRRAVLDQLTLTETIPSNVKWEHLDYGTRSTILFSNMVPGIK